MAITTEAAINAALPGQERDFNKANITSSGGNFMSLWAGAGLPAAGSLSIGNTTTGDIPTDATTGAFAFVNPASGNTYCGRIKINGQNVGTVIIYDRLWHGGSYTPANGNINTNDTTPIDRGSDGVGAEVWAEIATAHSATQIILTITYTNQAGTAGRTGTCTIPASAIASRMLPFVLESGDTGIRSIENLAGDAAPTGTFNLVILRRIATATIKQSGETYIYDWGYTGFRQIPDDACITMMMTTASGGTGILSGTMCLIQG